MAHINELSHSYIHYKCIGCFLEMDAGLIEGDTVFPVLKGLVFQWERQTK